ncbi:hypothetical protein ACLB2K_017010 [Fragaria x ananassa]
MSLLEWFANEYRKFGCSLEFATNKSQEGSQFCRGFGGIGGILCYQVDMRSFDELCDDDKVYDDSEKQSIISSPVLVQQGACEVGVATAASELVLKSVSGLIKEAPLSDPEKLDKVLSSGSLSKGFDVKSFLD